MTDDDWKAKLSPTQYEVFRKQGTEAPGSGEFVNFYEDGTYACAACGNKLFISDSKYESTIPGLIGWPAFSEAAHNGAVTLRDDNSHGMQRTEVLCGGCGGHLGHLFPDDSSPNGRHYCINSVCLNFESKKAL
ncbi:MAG: peptide-methionine (R)-S-oxide reductase [Patescibacteria group bacterium]|jgi:peptide-methionine (R)-S-oxide reductase|nr:peptide-methionine (R)-S-oxide reductase [Patescibacteria group bacterium]